MSIAKAYAQAARLGFDGETIMDSSGRPLSLALLFASSLSVVAFSAPAQDAVPPRIWVVTNNGVDESTCGTNASPCRSISQAIANASTGDAIHVGPGRYGDLDENRALGGVGEENGSCGAAVCVNKALRIVSREGAVRTIIDVTNVLTPRDGVRITANDVIFGRSNRGFTVRGAPNVGVQVQGSRIPIVDNIAIGNFAAGFALQATPPIDCHLIGNQAIGNIGGGFFVVGDSHLLEFNVAHSNGGVGFTLASSRGLRFYENHSISNAVGAAIDGGNDVRIAHSAFIGNREIGIVVLNQATGFVVAQSNFFGNGTRFDTANLGLLSNPGSRVSATNNFWGAATGPGPDPADQVTGDVRFVPFATKPFTIPSLDDVRRNRVSALAKPFDEPRPELPPSL